MDILDFHKFIIEELSKQSEPQNSSLLVLGRGLGLLDIVYHLIESYSDTKTLVFMLNAMQSEEEYLHEKWRYTHSDPFEDGTASSLGKETQPNNSFTIIHTETPVKDRVKYYTQGGIVSISSRMLISDMLLERIPFCMISGWIVLHAEGIHETSIEAFILYIYRQHNKTGFIKAFSDVPEMFSFGISSPSKQLRSLQVSKIFCFPRLHPKIKESLDSDSKQSIIHECRISFTPILRQIEECIISLMSDCWGELLLSCPELQNIASSNVDDYEEDWNAMDRLWLRSFDHLIHDRFGHAMGHRAFSILSDIKKLRELVDMMMDGDGISFYNLLEYIKSNPSTIDDSQELSNWLMLPQTRSLYQHAHTWFKACQKIVESSTSSNHYSNNNAILNQHPKWKCLSDIIKGIDITEANVLILVDNDSTLYLLTELLCTDASGVIRQRNGYNRLKSVLKHADSKNIEMSIPKVSEDLDANDEEISDDGKMFNPLDIYDLTLLKYESFGFITSKVIIKTISSCNPSPIQVLLDLCPTHIILYDTSYCISMIRSIDVYLAHKRMTDKALNVYFMVYDKSIEENRYTYQLKREKDAFDRLSSKKSHVILRFEANENLGTILIDMREFRGGLPFVLYKKGFTKMWPLVLQVGDFVLSPRICVERKTPEDLIGSFASGRLYDQVRSMTAYYDRPFLLIEYDIQAIPCSDVAGSDFPKQQSQHSWYRSKSLGHGKRSRIATTAVLTTQSTDRISQRDISSKVVLLLLSFPKLGLLWSPSPWFTAQLFLDLQKNEQPPDPYQAMSKADSSNIMIKRGDPLFDITTERMMTFIPGMTFLYQDIIREKFVSIKELASKTQTELDVTLGPSVSEQIYSFFHRDIETMGIKENDLR